MYNAYINTLAAQQRNEENAYRKKLDSQLARYDAQKVDRKAEAGRYWQSADIQRQFNNRDANQLMSAQGVTGGQSESSIARNQSRYENTSNDIRNNLDTALRDIDTNRSAAEGEGNIYLAQIASRYAQAIQDARLRQAEYEQQQAALAAQLAAYSSGGSGSRRSGGGGIDDGYSSQLNQLRDFYNKTGWEQGRSARSGSNGRLITPTATLNVLSAARDLYSKYG